LKGHHASSAAEAASGAVADYVLEAPEDSEDAPSEFNPLVIAERTVALRNMSVSDAVIELDMTGSQALAFRHAGSGRVNLVFRRTDGNIGWLDPSDVPPKAVAH